EDEVGHALYVAARVDPDDVGVADRGGEARLAPEPFDEQRVGRVGQDQLERDRATRRIERFVDGAHAALSEQRVDPEGPERLAGLERPHDSPARRNSSARAARWSGSMRRSNRSARTSTWAQLPRTSASSRPPSLSACSTPPPRSS